MWSLTSTAPLISVSSPLVRGRNGPTIVTHISLLVTPKTKIISTKKKEKKEELRRGTIPTILKFPQYRQSIIT